MIMDVLSNPATSNGGLHGHAAAAATVKIIPIRHSKSQDGGCVEDSVGLLCGGDLLWGRPFDIA